MSLIIDGSNGVTFPNSTTQAVAGLTGSTSQLCKAWVLFNGTSGSVTNSFNVSSVTRNGTGDYTLNFSTAMANANYAATCSSRQLTASGYLSIATDVNTSGSALTRTTSAYQIQCQNVVGGLNDNPYMQVVIFGS
jgi:hypothetical protein